MAHTWLRRDVEDAKLLCVQRCVSLEEKDRSAVPLEASAVEAEGFSAPALGVDDQEASAVSADRAFEPGAVCGQYLELSPRRPGRGADRTWNSRRHELPPRHMT